MHSSTLPVGAISGTTLNEIGGAVTLMDGTAFFVGGSGHTVRVAPNEEYR